MSGLDLIPERLAMPGGISMPTAVVLVTGLVGLLVLVVVVFLVRRVWVRHRVPADRVVTLLAVGVALALSADGAYRLLTRGLGLPAWEAAVVAAVAELALIAEAIRAERSIRRVGHPGGHQYAIAGIALGAGFVVSTNATSLPEWLVRFLVPQLAALLWWMGAREHLTTHQTDLARGTGRRPAGAREGTTWLVSPRRLAVQTGLIAATDGVDDLGALTRARRVRALARLLHRHTHTQSATVRRWRARRVHRLAETADTATITAVADQLVRTRTVLDMAGLLTEPAPAEQHDRADRRGRREHGPRPSPVDAAPGPHPLVAPSPVVAATSVETSAGRLHGVARGAAPDMTHRLGGALTDDTADDTSGTADGTGGSGDIGAVGVPAPPAPARAPRGARPADVARVRTALSVGDLTAPLTASAIAGHLGISREYAAAARQALHEATTADVTGNAPAAADRASSPPPTGLPDGTEPDPSGPAGQPVVAQPAPTPGEDRKPADAGAYRRSVPAFQSYTHA